MIVAVSIILVISFAVISVAVPSTFQYSGLSAEANQTLYTTVSASYNALSLWTIIPIVLIAALIIALTVGALKCFALSGAAE